MTLDLGEARLAEGGHLLLRRALAPLAPGEHLRVRGKDPELPVHLRVLARKWGHAFVEPDVVVRGEAPGARWVGASREGPSAEGALALRGALVESGAPRFDFPVQVPTEDAPRMYALAAGAQWDPAAIDWAAEFTLPDEIEDAVVQVMTYLVENELLALVVPARFCAQVHPHFREVMQVLAVQAADEARHVEVFARRAGLRRTVPGTSSASGQASLKTILDEPDFALASFLLSVMGEGTFLDLLRFLQDHAPDPVTRQVARLAAIDEARHVAFGLSHLGEHVRREPALLGRLAAAVEARHAALRETAGLNESVWDALILLAAGSFEPAALARGHARVMDLVATMDAMRRHRLGAIGFDEADAASLSALHTRNFM